MFTLEEILIATKGNNVGEKKQGEEITGFSIDSRVIKKGDIFIAIRGKKCDGHDFIGDALKNGAEGLITETGWYVRNSDSIDKKFRRDLFFIEVNDTTKGLQDIAHYQRKRYNILLIAITGSNGKTTTKEICGRILEKRFSILKSEGNFNNYIGLPLTLLKLRPEHAIALVELGISEPGELANLCRISHPDIGIITNIGYTHLQTLKNIDGVAAAKWELVEEMKEDGTIILNADDPILASMSKDTDRKLITYGIKNKADFMADNIESDPEKGLKFRVRRGNEQMIISTALFGIHNVYNILAAISAAVLSGVDSEPIIEAIAEFKPVPLRSEIITNKSGFIIINDSYNANPVSVMKAIDMMISLTAEGRKIAVLGDMLELGDYSETGHIRVGQYLVEKSVDYLITVGKLSELVAEGAIASGMKPENVKIVKENNEAADHIIRIAKKGDVILIKGSRGIKMEKIIELI